MALAGGVTIVLPQRKGYQYKEGGMLSHDGRCRTFDEISAGTVFSNGAAVVLLKRMEDAVAAGDTIYGVIRSEEHTSELQSLMRISYAVFCLNNKTRKQY